MNDNRETVAWVRKANGAYLIQFTGEIAADHPEDDNFDAASSLTVAKRVAVAGARSMGYSGAIRWEQHGHSRWELTMIYPDDEDY